ncbi:MAG: MYXO-CTERM sorting domain-containing protein [Pseudomonadota bacterium]
MVVHAAPAAAYVRKRTADTFVPMFWPDPRLTLEVARPPDGIGVTLDDLHAAARAAADSWSYPAIPCTGVTVQLGPAVTDSQVAGRDGKNRIIMRVGSWCRDPVTQSYCHDPAAVALTTFFSRSKPGAPNDGQILEADIEINAVGDYQWAAIPDGPISGRDYANVYDLPSVLTHETGHFIGLDHTCRVDGAPDLVDDRGDVYPGCFDVQAENQPLIMDATMFPFMNPAEMKLRTLTADDARAACEIYPTTSVPWEEWSGGGGCAAAPGPPSPAAWQGLATLAAIALSLRRPRHARAPSATRKFAR